MASTKIKCLCGKSETFMIGKTDTNPCPHCGRIYTGEYSKQRISNIRELESGILLKQTNYNNIIINNNKFVPEPNNYTCMCGKSKGTIFDIQTTMACEFCGRIYIGRYNNDTKTIDAVEYDRITLKGE